MGCKELKNSHLILYLPALSQPCMIPNSTDEPLPCGSVAVGAGVGWYRNSLP